MAAQMVEAVVAGRLEVYMDVAEVAEVLKAVQKLSHAAQPKPWLSLKPCAASSRHVFGGGAGGTGGSGGDGGQGGEGGGGGRGGDVGGGALGGLKGGTGGTAGNVGHDKASEAPCGHSHTALADDPAKLPGEHISGAVEPAEQAEPGGHGRHSAGAVMSVAMEKRPAGQSCGAEAPGGQYEPASHGRIAARGVGCCLVGTAAARRALGAAWAGSKAPRWTCEWWDFAIRKTLFNR
eukprot:1441835-Prymnesium_polylepis.1